MKKGSGVSESVCREKEAGMEGKMIGMNNEQWRMSNEISETLLKKDFEISCSA